MQPPMPWGNRAKAGSGRARFLLAQPHCSPLQEDAPLVNPSVPCRDVLGLTQVSSARPKEETQQDLLEMTIISIIVLIIITVL